MPVHQQRDEDAALGEAWRRCEAIADGDVISLHYWDDDKYFAACDDFDTDFLPTPTAALSALAEALERRNAE